MSYLSHQLVKTRKRHRCWGCVDVFPAGTMMHRMVYKDGGLVTTYCCEPCQQYVDEACKRDRYLELDGFEWGWVRESKQEAALEAERMEAKRG